MLPLTCELALDDLPAEHTGSRGAPVSITVKYDNVDHALENLNEERFYIISFQNRLKLLLLRNLCQEEVKVSRLRPKKSLEITLQKLSYSRLW